MTHEKQKGVQAAMSYADQNALSRMGRVGARHSAINRALREEERKKRILEATIEKAKTETITPDGDVLPPDPDLIAGLEER